MRDRKVRLKNLTETHWKVYEYISKYIREHLVSPAMWEIGKALGFSDTNAGYYVRSLEELGFLVYSGKRYIHFVDRKCDQCKEVITPYKARSEFNIRTGKNRVICYKCVQMKYKESA